MDDIQIISLFLARDEQAIRETQTKYGGYLFSIAQRILQSREDSEESVMSTYHAAWNSIPPAHPNRLSLYLGKITRSISLNTWRRMHADKRGSGETQTVLDELTECIAGSENVEAEAEYIHLIESINRFLSTLRKEDRFIFVLRYWHMYPIPEIAARLHAGESRIKTSLHRTRGKLRLYLIKEGYLT